MIQKIAEVLWYWYDINQTITKTIKEFKKQLRQFKKQLTLCIKTDKHVLSAVKITPSPIAATPANVLVKCLKITIFST